MEDPMPVRGRPRPAAPLPRLRRAAAWLVAVVLGTGAPLGASIVAPAPADAAILSWFTSAGSEPIAPGATHEWGSVGTQYGTQRVNVVTAEPYRGELSFRAAISNDTVTGLERTSLAAKRMSRDGGRVVAAINADVWSSTGTLLGQAPNGIHIQDGELVSGDGVARAVFGIGADRVPRIGQVRLGVSLTTATGAVFKVRRINQRPDEEGLNLFTGRFGTRLSRGLSGWEIVVGGLDLPIRPSGTWSGTVQTVREAGGGARIAPGTVVLVADEFSDAMFDLVPGAPVTLRTEITPGWEGVLQAVSGRGFLVRDGVPNVSPRPADGQWTHPRSALGLTWDGRVILLTVDGRGGGSRGLNLDDLASLLAERGAAQAINLDGGSSSSLAIRRTGDVDVSIANTPSKGYEIRTTNSLQLVSNVPTGPLSILSVTPTATNLYPGGTARFRLAGQDAAYNGIPISAGEVGWSVDPSVGRVDGAGRFTATAAGTAQLVATFRGAATSATVQVLPDYVAPAVEAPSIAFVRGAVAKRVAVRIAWPATSDAESGLARYELEHAVDGAWEPVALDAATALGATVPLERYRTHGFRLRAVDRAGNAGEWRELPPLHLGIVQETSSALALDGRWKRVAGRGYEGGHALTSRSRGATATYTFTGAGIGLVASRARALGGLRVSVDGEPTVLLDLRGEPADRQLVWSRTWPTAGEHVVTFTVAGTKGRPLVDLDALVVLGAGG